MFLPWVDNFLWESAKQKDPVLQLPEIHAYHSFLSLITEIQRGHWPLLLYLLPLLQTLGLLIKAILEHFKIQCPSYSFWPWFPSFLCQTLKSRRLKMSTYKWKIKKWLCKLREPYNRMKENLHVIISTDTEKVPNKI